MNKTQLTKALIEEYFKLDSLKNSIGKDDQHLNYQIIEISMMYQLGRIEVLKELLEREKEDEKNRRYPDLQRRRNI